VRRDALHKLTTHLAITYGTVSSRTWPSGTCRLPKPKADPENPGHHLETATGKAGLNRSLLDTAPGEFRRQLTYKMGWHGGHLLVADRFFPSSKKCSSCKETKATLFPRDEDLPLRTLWSHLDRDLNAARNLAPTARSTSSPGVARRLENGRRGDALSPKSPRGRKRQDGSGQPAKAVTASSQDEAP